jgi:hypothetical protein
VISPPRIAHFYLNLSEQKLYCLNETAGQVVREGIPILAADLQRHPLKTIDGEPVGPADLPLTRCRSEGKPLEAAFVLSRPGAAPQTLAWSAAPLKGPDGALCGVTATLVLPLPEPDWEEMAGLAHDLRTPLQTVRWLVPVLEALTLPATAGGVLDRLRGAADRAMAIGLDLLEWCRSPLQGTGRGERAWLPLEPLLVSLVAEQSAAAGRKNITLEVDVALTRGVLLHTNATRLGRLITNLLANAIRYTHTGKVRLRADWRTLARGAAVGPPRLGLIVEDTGAGLSGEDAESIFQAFRRGKAGKADTDSGGSGLGLAVVDRLIHDLGLSLEVFSESGQGSRFEVLLPPDAIRRPT